MRKLKVSQIKIERKWKCKKTFAQEKLTNREEIILAVTRFLNLHQQKINFNTHTHGLYFYAAKIIKRAYRRLKKEKNESSINRRESIEEEEK